jgi:hypothetical protein
LAKDNTLEEQGLKIEHLESRMREASKKAAMVKDLEASLKLLLLLLNCFFEFTPCFLNFVDLGFEVFDHGSASLGAKDNTLEEQGLKIEHLESRMREASKKAAMVKAQDELRTRLALLRQSEAPSFVAQLFFRVHSLLFEDSRGVRLTWSQGQYPRRAGPKN